MKSIFKNIGIVLLAVLGAYSYSYAQSNVISRTAANGSSVIIAWAPAEGAEAYQVFRKLANESSYPAQALNANPIGPISNCTVIKGILLSPDSTDWKLIAHGLGDADGLFDPCDIATLSTADDRYNRLLFLAAFNINIAKISGLAFEDATTTNGEAYDYRVVALDGEGEAMIVANDLSITAGQVFPPPPPQNIQAEGGDNEILVTWDTDTPRAAGYRVLRAISPAGFYQQVNQTDYSFLMKNKLNGDTLLPAKFGFHDFQTWDTLGQVSLRNVHGNAISGPRNGFAYYYKVQSVDLLGRTGLLSTELIMAVPQDNTPPAVPDGISTIPDETSNNGSVEIRWRHVTHDVNRHLEDPGVVTYEVYRFESTQNPDSSPGTLVANVPAPGSSTDPQVVQTVDNAVGLRSPHEDKTWWYRLKAIDNAGNKSNWTAAIRATLKDINPPAVPAGLVADGFEDRIELNWSANTDPDIQTYQVYRSFCHYGEWVPCPDPVKPVSPDCEPCEEQKKQFTNDRAGDFSPCSGPFMFVGEITHDSLLRAVAAANALFIDRTIPAASPLCYAYWIKAIDNSGNRSGEFPFPSPVEESQIVCERLRDKTPPEAAIITGLIARDHAIKVSWIAPPMQDTRAFHVYRASEVTAQVEPDITDFNWIGGLTVEQPPALPTLLHSPYNSPAVTTCDRVPVQISEKMSSGEILDSSTDPHQVYWYKVTGIDADGNETDLKKAVSASTFTFQTAQQMPPSIEVVAVQEEPCRLVLEWFPPFEPEHHIGFLVYKSLSEAGPFIQASTLLQENSFQDEKVVKGQSYWYKVAILQVDGKISETSTVYAITL